VPLPLGLFVQVEEHTPGVLPVTAPVTRGLRSYKPRLNLSQFWPWKPQPASTSQLNLSRFHDFKHANWPTDITHDKPKSGGVLPKTRCLR